MGERRDLFISHNSKDRTLALEVRRACEAAGHSCWMAPDDVGGPGTWAEQILEAIEGCRVLIVLLSARANRSVHVAREVELAVARGTPILPIRIESVAPSGALKYLLTLIQRVDAFPPPFARHESAVMHHVRALLEGEATVRESGSRLIADLALRPDAGRLPSPLSELVGRSSELAEVAGLLAANRLVTITGVGGVGKTRLAIEAARQARGRFPSVGFVDLASVREAALVPHAVREALRIQIGTEEDPADAVIRALSSEASLVVLDNMEQVADAARFLAGLLSEAPELHLLVTSRTPLGIRGEREYALGPLALPHRGDAAPEVLSENDAVRLFMAEVRRHGPVELTPSSAPVVAEICRRLDGLPLALELVAGQSRSMSFATMLGRLEHRLEIASVDVDLPDRQKTLRAAIAWSADMLGSEARLAFAQLSVFVDGFTREAAEAVTDPDVSIDEVLHAMVRHSLVSRVRGAQERFAMLETVREFALEELIAGARADSARERAAVWLAGLLEDVEAAYAGAHDRTAALDRADAERNNVRDALTWAAASGRDDLAMRLASGKSFWAVRGGVLEGLRWLRELIDRPVSYATRTRAQGLTALAGLATNVGNLAEGRARFEEALSLWAKLGEQRRIGVVHNNLGILAERQDDLQRSQVHLEQALAIMRELDDRVGVAAIVGNLGMLADRRDDLGAAENWNNEALRIARELNDDLTMGIALTNLAGIALKRGDLDLAKSRSSDSLELAQRLEDVEGTIICLETLAQIAERDGRIEDEVRLLAGAERLRAASGFAPYPSWAPELAALKARARTMIGDDIFDALWEDGVGLDQPDLVALARGSTSSAGRTTD